MKQNFETVNKILENECITPVYQPIVSLVNGQVYGYEALSRIANENLTMNIETMFRTADQMGKAWEMESLCRKKALKNARLMPENAKLFLNVNSNIINDNKFKAGFTRRKLNKYEIDSENIIFEITERVAILDRNTFFESINHYKEQNYGIAIDDVGSGYSGLNVIVDAKPTFIKLDMYLVRNIDKDETKIALCKAFVEFCKNSNIKMIAEGIETESELRTLVQLGVPYGQGYFLGIPKADFTTIEADKQQLIADCFSNGYVETNKDGIFPPIESICKRSTAVAPGTKAIEVFELLSQNPSIMEVCVVREERPVGFMTRGDIYAAFGGRYGYDLNYKKSMKEIMNTEFLRVNCGVPIDRVSRLAMQRPHEMLYNPIVVEKDNKYLGIVTVKDLLDSCTRIQVDSAMHSNPLTGLPGNHQIEKEIMGRLFGEDPFCITYYDLDNFKAYNDAYGFGNGDLMLVMVADILKDCARNREFVGHIGGDDFIVISDYNDCSGYCQTVIEAFSNRVLTLYNNTDVENQYIISKNRHGVTEQFPLASLSIAGISNREKKYRSIHDFSKDIAVLKKKCKARNGNYFEIL